MIKLSSQNLLIVFSFRETKLNIYCLKPAPTQIFHAQNPLLPNEENLTFSVAANRANSLAPSPHTETMGSEFKKCIMTLRIQPFLVIKYGKSIVADHSNPISYFH